MPTVYLIHFAEPFHHARHYLGFTGGTSAAGLRRRLARHRAGRGARLLAALKAAGIGWECVRVWPGFDRAAERKLKKRKGAAGLCPVCTPGTREGGPVCRPPRP